MKVRIDYDLCMGDGNCHKVCPEVFDYDDDQMIGIVREETVPAEHEESVKRAADECDPGAIVLEK
jgi:ferredoxin